MGNAIFNSIVFVCDSLVLIDRRTVRCCHQRSSSDDDDDDA